jgi:hypothetical protein
MGSTLVLELWRATDNSNKHVVRAIYNQRVVVWGLQSNNAVPCSIGSLVCTCMAQSLFGESEPIALESFVSKALDLVPRDYEAECCKQ